MRRWRLTHPACSVAVTDYNAQPLKAIGKIGGKYNDDSSPLAGSVHAHNIRSYRLLMNQQHPETK